MPVAKIKSIHPNGSWESKRGNCTMYSFVYAFESVNGGPDVMVEANHKREGGIFSVGDEAEYDVTQQMSENVPHKATVKKPSFGAYGKPSPEPSRFGGAAPASAATPDQRDTRIEDQVIFKGAIELYKCGELSIETCVGRAVRVMDAVKARHDAPQPVAAEEDNVPF